VTGAEGEAATGSSGASGPADDGGSFTFDRHLVLEQLGGWRGMVDASLPTIAFIVANALGGLWAGIWAAIGCAVLIFMLRLVRRESVQQAVSGLFGVVVAVVIAAASGHARDYFVLGIFRNAAIGVVLVGSTLVRRPLVGVIAEFLAPSHLGALATHSFPLLRGRFGRAPASAEPAPGAAAAPDRRAADPAPERHWRQDRRMVRAYTWLTLLWGATFLARVVVQGPLYQRNEVGLLGTTSLLLGLPVTAVALVVTLWVVARLHRHRHPEPAARRAGDEERPAA
jgi:hypothetical protein